MRLPITIPDLRAYASIAAILSFASSESLAQKEALDLEGEQVEFWVDGWSEQTEVTRDGVDAMEARGAGGRATIEMFLQQRTLVRYWMKLGSERAWMHGDGSLYSSGITGRKSDWEMGEILVDEPGGGKARWTFHPRLQTDEVAGWLDQVELLPPISVADAIDTDLPVTTGGSSAWRGWDSKLLSADGEDFVSSGEPGNEDPGWLEVTAEGTGTLSFRYSHNGGSDENILLTIDGEHTVLPGTAGWSRYVTELGSGSHTIRFSTRQRKFVYLDQLSWQPGPPPANSALDTDGFSWTQTGEIAWVPDTDTTHDGTDSLRVGPEPAREDFSGNSTTGHLSSLVQGPALLSFWWKQDRATHDDRFSPEALHLLIDDEAVITRDATFDWTKEQWSIPPGLHKLEWRFGQGGFASGMDQAWIDEVEIIAAENVPLGEAVEAEELSWKTGEPFAWEGGPSIAAPDSIDMAFGPNVSLSDQTSGWIETEVVGPGSLEFQWRGGRQDFVINGEVRLVYDDFELRWERVITQIGSGHHTLRWYARDSGANLDGVNFIPGDRTAFAEALDTTEVEVTGIAEQWQSIDLATAVGGKALRTSPGLERSKLYSRLIGPGTLKFLWNNSSTAGELYFAYGNESVVATSRGTWSEKSVDLPAGEHNVLWDFRRWNSPGDPSAMLDAIEWIPDASTEAAIALDIDQADAAQAFHNFEPGSTWSTTVDPGLTRDGIDAVVAKEGAEGFNAITGPGVLSFWVKQIDALDGELRLQSERLLESVIPGQGWQHVTIYLQPRTYSVRWIPTAGPSGNSPRFLIDQMQLLPTTDLQEALDSDLVFTTGSDPWIGIPTSLGGAAATVAHASVLDGSSVAWLETQVEGPASLSYRWRLNGSGRLLIDGEEKVQHNTELDWNEATQSIPAGLHTVRWELEPPFEPRRAFFQVDQVRLTSGEALTVESALDLPDEIRATVQVNPTGWKAQRTTTHDQIDALQFGPSVEVGLLDLSVTLQQPAMLSFWIKIDQGTLDVYTNNASTFTSLPLGTPLNWRLIEIPLSTGEHQVTMDFNLTGVDSTILGWIDEVSLTPTIPLEEALDTSGLTWTTGGDEMWAGLPFNSAFDGADAAIAPVIEPGKVAWLETTVVGPGDFSFSWRASSGELSVALDGAVIREWPDSAATQEQRGGERVVFHIPSGTHAVRFNQPGSFRQAYLDSTIDQVMFTTGAIDPIREVIEFPTDTTLVLGPALAWKTEAGAGHDGGDALVFELDRTADPQFSPVPGHLTVINLNRRGVFPIWAMDSSPAGGASSATRFIDERSWTPLLEGNPIKESWYFTEENIGDGDDKAGILVSVSAQESVRYVFDEVGLLLSLTLSQALDSNATFTSTGLVTGVQSPLARDGIDHVIIDPGASLSTTVSTGQTVEFWWRGFDVTTQIGTEEFALGNSESWRRSSMFVTGGDATQPVTWRIGDPLANPSSINIDSFEVSDGSPASDAFELPEQNPVVVTGEGAGGWISQSAVTHDGVDALRATDASSITVTTNSPSRQVVSFWWRVDAPEGATFNGGSIDLRLGNDPLITLRPTDFAADTGWHYFHTIVEADTPSLSWIFAPGSEEFPSTAYMDEFKAIPLTANSLNEALENETLTFTSSSPVAWTGFVSADEAADGVDAAVSGSFDDTHSEAWIETQVVGPGTLEFDWRMMHSRFETSVLSCSIDPGTLDAITRFASERWEHVKVDIPPGQHLVRWRYFRDRSNPSAVVPNLAMLDQVKFSRNTPLFVAALGGPFPGPVFHNWEMVDDPERGTIAFSGKTMGETTPFLEFTDYGPGVLTFDANIDGRLSVHVDGRLARRYPSTDGWESISVPIDQGAHSVVVSLTPDTSEQQTSAEATLSNMVVAAQLSDIGQAINVVYPVIAEGWSAFRSDAAPDEQDAIQTMWPAADGLRSSLQTTIEGPGTVRFHWRLLAAPGAGGEPFAWDIPGVGSGSLDAIGPWREVTQVVPAGNHTITWQGPSSLGSLDKLSFTPDGLPASYQEWAVGYGLDADNGDPEFVGPAGIANVVAYSSGVNPLTAALEGSPPFPLPFSAPMELQIRTRGDSDRLALYYLRRKTSDFFCRPELSNDLKNWFAVLSQASEIKPKILDLGNGMEIVIQDDPSRFRPNRIYFGRLVILLSQ